MSLAFRKAHDSCRRRPDDGRAGLCIRIGALTHVKAICSEYTRGNTQLTGPELIRLVHPVQQILALAPLPNGQHQPRAQRVGCMLLLGSPRLTSCAPRSSETTDGQPHTAASRYEREQQHWRRHH